MSYTNSRANIKWWEPHTNKLKYCSSAKFDEHNNKFSKGWSPGFNLMLVTNIYTLPKFKMTYQIIPSSNTIYFNLMIIPHQEVLLLLGGPY